ncbi:MAG: phosphoribosylamine--glycine ligase [Deltaproteobacteria bacterium]|nr:phosphoribosylamine--glycine ligase [Deltaproteobacteria bacterium]
MRILVVGGGGREHALVDALARSRSKPEILCAPGNAGIADVAECLPAVSASDVDGIADLARARRVDLVVVGPEAPLVAGLADVLAALGVAVFGPTREAARLEGSKAFSKRFMKRFGIPTAPFEIFDSAVDAEAYLRKRGTGLVVKADGLAAGKGVVVAADADEGLAAVARFMRARELGDAGATVVIEEKLSGDEASFHVICDGERRVVLAAARDHKRLLDGDRGPNTGGMGACSPHPGVTPEVERFVLDRVVDPTLAGMRELGAPFRGARFVGLMRTPEGPSVLEYNVRFGDPEAEVLFARYGGDACALLTSAARGELASAAPEWDAPAAVAVVLASAGYPKTASARVPIEGLEEAARVGGSRVYHAGTAREGGRVVVAGGRVLAVTATGPSLAAARATAYEAAACIRFEGMQRRADIGATLI